MYNASEIFTEDEIKQISHWQKIIQEDLENVQKLSDNALSTKDWNEPQLYTNFFKHILECYNEVTVIITNKIVTQKLNAAEALKSAYSLLNIDKKSLAPSSTAFLKIITSLVSTKFEQIKQEWNATISKELRVTAEGMPTLEASVEKTIDSCTKDYITAFQLLNLDIEEEDVNLPIKLKPDCIDYVSRALSIREASSSCKADALVRLHASTLLQWRRPVNQAFDNLDIHDPSSCNHLLNALMLFQKNITQMFPDHDDDQKSHFHKALSQFLIDSNETFILQPDNPAIPEDPEDPDKAKDPKIKYIKDMLNQARLITQLNSPKHNKIMCQLSQANAKHILNLDVTYDDDSSNSILPKLVQAEISQVLVAVNFLFSELMERTRISSPTEVLNDYKRYEHLQNFLVQHPVLIDKLSATKHLTLAQVQSEQNLREVFAKQKSTTPKQALDKLKQLEKSNKRISLASEEKQAVFKHHVSKAKYKITDQEIRLLRQITGIPVQKLILTSENRTLYPRNTFTYSRFSKEIEQLIRMRKQENNKWHRKYVPFRRLPLSPLHYAKAYLEFHSIKLNATTKPEVRLLNKECSLISLKSMFNQDKLDYVPFSSNTAYVRVKADGVNTIYYIDKASRVCTEIKLKRKDLLKFDLKMEPENARNLTRKELDKISKLTNHNCPTGSNQSLRSVFARFAKSLSSLLPANRAVKKLNVLFEQKTQYANSLKEKAVLLKGAANHSARDNRTFNRVEGLHQIDETNKLIARGQLFEPSTLKAKFSLFNESPLNTKLVNLLHLESDVLNSISILNSKIERAKNKYFTITNLPHKAKANSGQLPEPGNGHSKTIDIYNACLDKINKLPPLENTNTQPDLQVYLDEASFLLMVLEDKIRDETSTKLAYLPIRQYLDLTKIDCVNNYRALIEKSKLPADFNPNDEKALENVGAMLVASKTAYKHLFESGKLYIAALALLLQAKNEVLTLVTSMSDTATRDAILDQKINELSSTDVYNYGYSMFKRSTEHTCPYSKILEMIKDLKSFTHLNDHDYAIKVGEYQEGIKSTVEYQKAETGKTESLLSAAKQTVDALIYFSDHTTSMLNDGSRRQTM